MIAGSFYPGQAEACLHAMAGDDCSLHFDLDELTPKQQADHQANIKLTGMLQVALMLLGSPRDHLALYAEFRQPPWSAVLERHRGWFASLGKPMIPAAHCHYHPSASFYASLARDLPDTPLLNLYMISGSNRVLHRDPAALEISRQLNSKFHFAEHAPRFGLPVPRTLTCTRSELRSDRVAAFFRDEPDGVILKTLGLAGARNVTAVDSIDACEAYLAEYADTMPVLLQQRLPQDCYTEMTADLRLNRDRCEISNVRKILFADGLWVGNAIGPKVELAPAHEALLLEVGRYVQQHGYGAERDINCGVDFFVGDDGRMLITEINARWTGGLFPSEVLRKLALVGQPATVFFDLVPTARLEDYLAFEERYLLGQRHGAFHTLPLGFSPFVTDIDGAPRFFVWQLVVGDFHAFAARKQGELGTAVLPTADRIPL